MSNADVTEAESRQLMFIREETRFEIVLLHERVNALIGAEAFLTIAFTAALSNTNAHWGMTFSLIVPPILSVTGLLLAVLAWLGVNASFKIILRWNARQLQLFRDSPALSTALWRLQVNGRDDPDQHTTMLFARAVPVVFGITWTLLTFVALLLPRR
ncbi:hypothetical protein [Deinococcus sp.]|uniref:RipA family octameric membrane protein n=1 Tax=Deinococcus sp. TaxID=47478 RepID=UPI003C7BFB05